jgi:hypothetical protein
MPGGIMAISSVPSQLKPYLEYIKGEPFADVAARALADLCRKGGGAGRDFDPSRLNEHLGEICRLRDLPSAEPLRYGPKREEILSNKDVRRMVRQAKALMQDIQKLRATTLAVYFSTRGEIPEGDLLRLNQSLEVLRGTAKVESFLSRYGKTKTPLLDYAVSALCDYIKATTGAWNDRLMADILTPLEIPHTKSADAFKMWRTGLTKTKKK